jgi:pimeloyl-ACP methyl ester carboxylesterase
MINNDLPAAIEAEELPCELPTGGSVLCYHRQGEGRPLLLLHSSNAAPSAFEMSPFFRESALAFNRPLYAPDLPGFGRSARVDRAYDARFFAQSIVEMIQAIGSGAVDIVALSTSSEFAARVAKDAPELVNSLTLLSPTGFVRRRESASTVGPKVYRFLRRPYIGLPLYRLLRSRVSVRFFLSKGFEGKIPPGMVDYACATAAQPGASRAPFCFVSGRMFTPDAVGDLYLPLQQSVLVLYDEDPNISFEFLDDVVDARPNWQKVRISPTRGIPHFEEPTQTRAALDAFWSGAEGT